MRGRIGDFKQVNYGSRIRPVIRQLYQEGTAESLACLEASVKRFLRMINHTAALIIHKNKGTSFIYPRRARFSNFYLAQYRSSNIYMLGICSSSQFKSIGQLRKKYFGVWRVELAMASAHLWTGFVWAVAALPGQLLTLPLVYKVPVAGLSFFIV